MGRIYVLIPCCLVLVTVIKFFWFFFFFLEIVSSNNTSILKYKYIFLSFYRKETTGGTAVGNIGNDAGVFFSAREQRSWASG